MSRGKGKPFTSETARKAGQKSRRAPSIPDLAKVQDLRAADLRKLITIYMNKSKDELQELMKDGSLPGLQLVIIRQVLQAIQKGDFGGIDLMLQRVLGKVPNQNINENHDMSEKEKALDEIPAERLISLVRAGGD